MSGTLLLRPTKKYQRFSGTLLLRRSQKPDLNIFNMAREDLKMDLSTALRESCQQDTEVVVENILVKNNGWEIMVNLTVQKITDAEQLQGLYLVVFECNTSNVPVSGGKKTRVTVKGSESLLIKNLKKNLQHTRETLQSTIEELETTNEELKSTNEELQSTNEELQSSNEEIETSKEEMVSLNEELQTTNSELQSKINEYITTSDDMKNLLNSTNIATLFLDNDLNIKRFTSETKNIINLIASDIGRPIGDIVSKFEYPSFINDCRNVLKNLSSKDLEIQTNGKQWYRLRIQPYRTSENKIEGLVITFMDITDFKNN